MIRCILNGAAIRDRRELHEALAAGLELPEWYGGNLDGLYDCLTELPDRYLKVTGAAALTESLGAYGQGFRNAVTAAARENPGFFLEWDETEEPDEKAK